MNAPSCGGPVDMHPYLAAYWEGRRDYPNPTNPYHDYTQAHMWRLGWTYSKESSE